MDPPRRHRRLGRPAYVLVATFAGMVLAFIVSTVLAGSATAAPLPGHPGAVPGPAPSVVPTGAIATATGSTVADSTSPLITGAPITSVPTTTSTVRSVATTVLHLVTAPVGPLLTKVTGTVDQATPAGPLATAFTPAGAPVASTDSPATAVPSGVDSSDPTPGRLDAHSRAVDHRTLAGDQGLRSAMTSPSPLRTPFLPVPLRKPLLPPRNLPATPSPPGEGLPSGHGGSQSGSATSTGLLVPLPRMGVASPGRERLPRLLLDVRHSPPG